MKRRHSLASVPWLCALVGAGLFACDGRQTPPDDGGLPDAEEAGDEPDAGDPGGPDAGDPGGPDVVVPDHEHTSGPPKPWTVGAPETLEIATWNLREFPLQPETPLSAAHLIAEMDLDLVAVQEISDVDAFALLLADLPGYAGVLSTHEYGTGEYQKTGLIYRTSEIQVSGALSLFSGDTSPFPRPPLKADVRVDRGGGNTLDLVVIVVHLKAGTAYDDFTRRRAAIIKLHDYVAGLLTADPAARVLILGDFNDEPDDPEAENAYYAVLQDPDRFDILTLPIAERGGYSYIPAEVLLDNQVATAALAALAAGGETLVVPLDSQVTAYTYETQISDHLPVVTVFP